MTVFNNHRQRMSYSLFVTSVHTIGNCELVGYLWSEKAFETFGVLVLMLVFMGSKWP